MYTCIYAGRERASRLMHACIYSGREPPGCADVKERHRRISPADSMAKAVPTQHRQAALSLASRTSRSSPWLHSSGSLLATDNVGLCGCAGAATKVRKTPDATGRSASPSSIVRGPQKGRDQRKRCHHAPPAAPPAQAQRRRSKCRVLNEHMHEHDTLDMQDIHRVLVQSLLFPSPFLRHLSRLTFLLMHDNNYQFDT